jgi:hypothetical protein
MGRLPAGSGLGQVLHGLRSHHHGDVHAPHLVLQEVQHLVGVLVGAVHAVAAVVTVVLWRRGLLEEGHRLHPDWGHGEILLGRIF